MIKFKYTIDQQVNIDDVIYTLAELNKDNKPLLFVGIGTPKILLDSIGPHIATQLQVRGFKVRGTLKRPVHALNIRKFLKSINLNDYFVIALDASIGEDIGSIIIKQGAIHPGASVGKTLPPIGNLAIKFIVARPEDFHDKSPEAINEALRTDVFGVIPIFENKIINLFRTLRKKGVI